MILNIYMWVGACRLRNKLRISIIQLFISGPRWWYASFFSVIYPKVNEVLKESGLEGKATVSCDDFIKIMLAAS